MGPVCCCFCILYWSSCCIHIFCCPFQMSDICEACALYHSICIFVMDSCYIVEGYLWSHNTVQLLYDIKLSALLLLVVSHIAVGTFCTCSLSAQLNTSLLVISSSFSLWLILYYFHHYFDNWIYFLRTSILREKLFLRWGLTQHLSLSGWAP